MTRHLRVAVSEVQRYGRKCEGQNAEGNGSRGENLKGEGLRGTVLRVGNIIRLNVNVQV